MCQFCLSFLYFYHWCNQIQVWLSASAKASTHEAGAHVKGKWFIQVLAMWKVGDSHLKAHFSGKMEDSCLEAHLYLSVETGFLYRGRG